VNIVAAGKNKISNFVASGSRNYKTDFSFSNKKFDGDIKIQYNVERPTLAGGDIIIKVIIERL